MEWVITKYVHIFLLLEKKHVHLLIIAKGDDEWTLWTSREITLKINFPYLLVLNIVGVSIFNIYSTCIHI